jgi:dTDP-4-amino-4,6-dideoxygalactose transaminase
MRTLHTANPTASYLADRVAIDAAVRRVLEGGPYVLGPVVQAFERDFAAWIAGGKAEGVGVNSGTDALHIALRALGIGPGDEVITAAHTAVATVAAIELAGASAVLADIEPRWHTLDPAAAEALVGPRTRAVIAVHLYGQPADVAALQSLCQRRGLALIEDCAQAHGARWHSRGVGTLGQAAAFSFYPTKNLGAAGDAGMIVTAEPALAARCRALRQYGWTERHDSAMAGCNSRLDPLQAAILAVKLPRLAAANAARQALAARYSAAFHGLPLQVPAVRPGTEHVFHLYVLAVDDPARREPLIRHLAARDIAAGVHYRAAVHQQPAYAARLRRGPLPVTEDLVQRIVSLPLYPELTHPEQDRVIAAVREFHEAP